MGKSILNEAPSFHPSNERGNRRKIEAPRPAIQDRRLEAKRSGLQTLINFDNHARALGA